MRTLFTTVAVVGALSLAGVAQADVHFFENFDYETVTPGESIAGLGQADSGDESGTGFTGNWQPNAPFYWPDTLQYPGITATAGRGETWSNFNTGRTFDTGSLTANGATQYGRFLFNFNGQEPSGDERFLWFSNGSSDGAGVNFSTDTAADPNVGIMATRLGGANSGSVEFSLTQTHLVVMRFMWSDTAGADQIDVWLDPADFTNLGAPSLTQTGDIVPEGDFYPRAQGQTYDIDELILADTLGEIGIPEPTTLSLLALGGLALIRRRKK